MRTSTPKPRSIQNSGCHNMQGLPQSKLPGICRPSPSLSAVPPQCCLSEFNFIRQKPSQGVVPRAVMWGLVQEGGPEHPLPRGPGVAGRRREATPTSHLTPANPHLSAPAIATFFWRHSGRRQPAPPPQLPARPIWHTASLSARRLARLSLQLLQGGPGAVGVRHLPFADAVHGEGVHPQPVAGRCATRWATG